MTMPPDPFPDPDAAYADALPPIRAARLLLRAFAPPDDPAIQALFSDERALKTWTHPAFASIDDARAYRARLAEGFQRRSLFVWGAFEPGDAGGPLVGIGILTRWAPNHRRVDLGYYLGSPYWGQGYATEIARALAGFAFERLGVHRVEAEVVPGNDASARVLARVGFRHEARLAERLWSREEGPFDADLYYLLRPVFEAASG